MEISGNIYGWNWNITLGWIYCKNSIGNVNKFVVTHCSCGHSYCEQIECVLCNPLLLLIWPRNKTVSKTVVYLYLLTGL